MQRVVENMVLCSVYPKCWWAPHYIIDPTGDRSFDTSPCLMLFGAPRATAITSSYGLRYEAAAVEIPELEAFQEH